MKAVERELLKRLVNDCITYDLNEKESMEYIGMKFPNSITTRTYYKYKRSLNSESVAIDWLTKFSKIGFVQNHQRLIIDAKRVYQDSLRRYFFEMAKGKAANRYLIMKLEESYRQNGKWLLSLSMGSPIIAQIKAKIEAANKIELPKEDVTKLEQDNQNIGIESRSGLSTLIDYSKYDKLISRNGESDESENDNSDDNEPSTEAEGEGLESRENDLASGPTEKRIRTRNDEFIEGGANVTDRVF